MTLANRLILRLVLMTGLLAAPFFIVGAISCGQDSDCPSGNICSNSICIALPSEKGFSVTITIPGPPPPPPEVQGPGIFIPPTAQPTTAIFLGRAYQGAFITVLKDGYVAATSRATSLGDFNITIPGLSQKTYTFSIFAEDSDGRISPAVTFEISLIAETITRISDILLAPTIGIDKKQAAQGEKLKIFGQSFPDGEIYLFIENVSGKTKADSSGRWQYEFDTSVFAPGAYNIRVKAITADGKVSPFSQTIKFRILRPEEIVPPEVLPPGICERGDLSGDGKADIVDVSIWLYWLGTSNECADQNKDRIADIIDFSIILYYWTEA